MGKRHKRRRMVNRMMPHRGPVILTQPPVPLEPVRDQLLAQEMKVIMALTAMTRVTFIEPPVQEMTAKEVAMTMQAGLRRLGQTGQIWAMVAPALVRQKPTTS